MVLNAFLLSFKTNLETYFQHSWRASHRGRCSDFYKLFAISISGRDQKYLCWLICWKLLNLPSLRKTFIAFSLLCAILLLYHIYISSLSVSNAWTCKCSPHTVFFLSRVFSLYIWAKNERVIGRVNWLQVCSLLLHLVRVRSSINAESQQQNMEVVDILLQTQYMISI